jgi:very-short-patch-repair endonuclease
MPNYRDLLIRAERRALTDHGVISRDEAREEGLSDRVVDGCVASGRWIRVHPRVFRIAAHPETFYGRARAALKWAGDTAFLSHGSTLALEGLDGFPQGEIHITAPTGRNIPGVIVHRLRRPSRTRIRRGIRTCRIERALLDVCADQSPIRCGEAMEDALRRNMTSLDLLWTELRVGGPGVRGCKVFRTLLLGRDHRDGKLESKLEAKLLVILRRIKEHDFIAQHPVSARGRKYRLDFYQADRCLGIEGRGVKWHLGNEWIKRDMERHNALTLSGITMLYFSWDDVTLRAVEVEAEIREILAAPRLSASL